MRRFKDLEIWKRNRIFYSKIYTGTANFPKNEKFRITNQLRLASVSIPSNIAEDSSRISNKEFSIFFEIAIGLNYEIENQLVISNDFKI